MPQCLNALLAHPNQVQLNYNLLVSVPQCTAAKLGNVRNDNFIRLCAQGRVKKKSIMENSIQGPGPPPRLWKFFLKPSLSSSEQSFILTVLSSLSFSEMQKEVSGLEVGQGDNFAAFMCLCCWQAFIIPIWSYFESTFLFSKIPVLFLFCMTV